ncbi:SHOCT domain-containing protein [Streptomyces anulatus]|uniref:SHOCT domain-containing protein n=1 Tax=Streptomyces anulatus TaxID=1892 RepID=UPI00386AE366|nr:SHOCT domain-containing protein [Streptomyces anulatus]
MPQRFGRPGLLGTIARTAVISGTATAVSNLVERRDMRRQAAAQAPQMPAAAPSAPALAGTGRVSQLTQLAGLKTQGLLAEEEFATEKARVLGS